MIDPKEIERSVVAYQGGKLCDGDVPIGVKLVADVAKLAAHFKTKGFALSVKKHESEESLAVIKLVATQGFVAQVVQVAPPAEAKEG